MLTPNDRQSLSAQLELLFPSYAALEGLSYNQLGWNLNTRAGDQTLPTAIRAILMYEEARDQCLTLLQALVDYTPSNRTLPVLAGQLLAKVKAARAAQGRDDIWYQPPTPFDTCFLQARAPFFDRQTLRSKLQTLGNGTYRVLVITGARLSGKSYAVRFLGFLARQCGAFGTTFRLADIDLKENRSSQIAVEFLVQRILLQLDPGASPPPTLDGQCSHRAQLLAEWLTELAERRQEVFCIALDHFDATLLPDEVHVFINHLANRAFMSDRLRLVLVGYPLNELPVEASDIIDEENLGVPTDTDVEEFFAQVQAHKQVALAHAPRDLARQLLGTVAVPRGDPMFLPALTRAAKTHILALFP